MRVERQVLFLFPYAKKAEWFRICDQKSTESLNTETATETQKSHIKFPGTYFFYVHFKTKQNIE